MVLGGQNGLLEYYKNTGTANTDSGSDQDSLGGNFRKAGVTVLIWTYETSSLTLTEKKNERVAQGSNQGTLTVALTGSSSTSIQFTSDVNQVFTPDAQLTVGESTVAASDLTSISKVAETYIDPLAGINIGEYSNPLFFDIDDDGDEDLIVGSADGKLSFFERNGCSPKNVCNGRGACVANSAVGKLPVCDCSTVDAVGAQCEFCGPGFVGK